MVTAGLRCAPLKVPTAYTATATPNAQPAVMTIQPAFWPLVLLSTTFATTPSPRMTSSMVPSSSARKGGIRLNGKRRRYQRGSALSTHSRVGTIQALHDHTRCRGIDMKFAILIYTDDTLLNALPEGQFDAKMRDCLAHADELRQDGRLLDSQMLERAATAKSLRVRNDLAVAARSSIWESSKRPSWRSS